MSILMSFLSWLWHFALEALIFAVLVALYFESRRGKSFVRRLLSGCTDMHKKISSDRNLLKQEIDCAIKSNCDKVPKGFVTSSVCKHGALTWNKRHIYTDVERKYYFPRKFSVLPLINGDEDFYKEGCACLADKIQHIDTTNNFRFVYLQKEANLLFSSELVGQHFPGKIVSHPINCDEARTSPRNLTFKYEMGESLAGFRVVLLESFVLVPDVLNETIKWLQEQGATVEAVAVLFMGAKEACYKNPCMIDQGHVKVANFVDMKITEFLPQKSEGKSVKVFTYCDY